MSMTKMSLSSLGTIALVLLAGSLWAQAQIPPGTNSASQTISGTVVSWSESSVVVETADGSQMAFALDSQNVLPGSLTAGSEVDVTYDTLSDGSYVATEVAIYDGNPVPAPAAPATAGPTTAPQGDDSLPQTASNLPLLALIGVLTLSLAALAWRLSRRAA